MGSNRRPSQREINGHKARIWFRMPPQCSAISSGALAVELKTIPCKTPQNNP